MSVSVLLSFRNYSHPELILFTDNVIYQTTTNPIFVSLKPLVDPVVARFNAFKAAYNAAKTGTSGLGDERDKKHPELLDVLTKLAKEGVEKLANGNKTIITASGFKPNNEVQPLDALLAPTNFEVFNLKTRCAIQLNWDSVVGKTAYAVEMRVVGTDNWTTIAIPTGCTLTLNGLVRGSFLEFRVRATGTRNIVSPWSLIVDVHVD